MGRSKQYEKPGGYSDALKDFKTLEVSEIKDIPDGKTGKLPDGRAINVRTKSEDGRPTLEIIDANKRTKIRYGNKLGNNYE